MARIEIIFIFLLSFSVLHANEKCRLRTHFEVFQQYKTNLLAIPAAVRPEMQKSILSPSGYFRIHFDSAGANVPSLVDSAGNPLANTAFHYVDSVAKIFDEVYEKEVHQFQFPPPPSDLGRGGGSEYDIYIIDYGENLVFGETVPENDYPLQPQKINQQYPTYIQIDNDFGAGFRTKGMLALRATAAHEFFHALQIGNYGLWSDDSYFYELTAEAMENTVFREAKDYIFDVKTYYKNISSIPLFTNINSTTTRGYERAIFGMFLMKKFGIQAMREVWNAIALERPVTAVQTALNKFSTTVTREFVDFTLWNFYTGERADSNKNYFDDAKYFTSLLFDERRLIVSPIVISSSLQAFTTMYYRVSNGSDSAYLLISNTNYDDVKSYSNSVFGFTLKLSPYMQNGFTEYATGFYGNFSSTTIFNWSVMPISHGLITVNITAPCFPNPFNPQQSSLLIQTDEQEGKAQTISIYSISMDLIYQNTASYKYFLGKRYIEWNGKKENGEMLGSGIYFYIVSDATKKTMGKFAVIR